MHQTRSYYIAYFSREVAKLVTQPAWPSSVPLSTSCSAMIATFEGLKLNALINEVTDGNLELVVPAELYLVV